MKLHSVVLRTGSWAGLFYSLLLASCASTEIQSYKLDRRIDIDGDNADWAQIPSYVVEKQNVTIAITNDNADLYLCLTSADQGVQRQFFRMGFTVWIDPDGGSHKTFGIRFPLKMDPGEMLDQRNDPQSDQGTGRSDHQQDGLDPQQDRSRAIPQRNLTEMELIGPSEGDVTMVSTLQEKEILVKARNVRQSLVYELRIPLRRIFAMSDGGSRGGNRIIGIGLESAELPSGMSKPGGNRAGGPPPGGRGGRGMDRPGAGGDEGGAGPQGGQRPSGGGRQQREEPTQIKLWVRTPLAY
jgi:hypothetical protein